MSSTTKRGDVEFAEVTTFINSNKVKGIHRDKVDQIKGTLKNGKCMKSTKRIFYNEM